jgi:hypothetical protein
MIYTIASTKLGIIGDPYLPAEGINVAALIAGGFIVEQSTPKPKNLLKLVQNLTRRFNPHGYQHLPI